MRERGAYRSTDPDTSAEAANETDATRLQGLVLGALGNLGPSTTEQLADHLQLAVITVSPRMKPLETKGLVERTEDRRPGRSGRMQIVWALKPGEAP